MPLPDVNWKKLARGSVVVATNPATEVLNGLWATVDPAVVTYYDASLRVPGASGPTVTRYQDAGVTESLHWPHPTGGHKTVISAQQAIPPGGVKSPTMRTPDTYVVNVLIANLVAEAGAFATWNAAQPFTSGRAFGNWRFCNLSVATWQWDIYECQEAWAITINISTNATPAALMIGAYLDPLSTLAADAETAGSPGRILGMMSAAAGVSTDFPFNTEWFHGNNQGRYGEHHTSNGQNHHGVLIPGQGGIYNVDRASEMANQLGYDANTLKTVGGVNVGHFGIPFHLMDDYRLIGVGRKLGFAPTTPIGAVFRNGGTDVAYNWASNNWITSNPPYALAA